MLAVCLVAYSVAVGLFFEQHLSAELDRRLHEDIELAARGLIFDEEGSPRWPGGTVGKIDEEEGGGHWLEVWTVAGERALASGTLDPLELPPPVSPVELHVSSSVDLPGRRVRMMTEPMEVGDRVVLIRAIVSEEAARTEAHRLWAELAALLVTVLAAGGAGGFLLTRHALAPLGRLATQAQRITAEHLHERLPSEGSSTETDQLGSAFNETLARLEGSFEQMRAFIADASHELRTPLTALRSVGETGLQRARSEDDYREVVGSMLEEVDRLARLTDELLAIARAESGDARLSLERVDLAALGREVVQHLSVLAEERGQSLVASFPESIAVEVDRTALRRALVNLLDNAIKYTPNGCRIEVRTSARDGAACVEVRDEGPGIAPEHRERIFERFYRIDKSRSRELGGTGLGLPLARWTAEAHGGRLELETEPGRGSVFRMVLPRA